MIRIPAIHIPKRISLTESESAENPEFDLDEDLSLPDRVPEVADVPEGTTSKMFPAAAAAVGIIAPSEGVAVPACEVRAVELSFS